MRQIDSRIMRGAAGIANGRNFVFDKRIFVQGEPVSEFGDAPGEIERRPAISWIYATAGCIAGRKEIMPQRSQGYRKVRAAKHAGAAHAKLKIGRRFKVDLEAVDHGLLRQSSADGEHCA